MTVTSNTDLGAFLRARRAHLAPSDVGLPPVSGERRRTPGLRREEVALLCGVSATWYTWLEQGRPISMSPSALARLATVLRLSQAERAYLFDLTRKRDPATARSHPDTPPLPAVLRALLAATAAPAYCLDGLWQACGWNEAAAQLFTGWLDGSEPNLLRYMFLDRSAQTFVADWPERARRLVAEFRAHAAEHAGNGAIGAVVADLHRASKAFASFWDEQGVLAREGGLRVFNHPTRGHLAFEQVTLVPSGHNFFKVVMLLPAGDKP
jgi:transcriptional regulator with XRE-family HTH domain